MPGLQRAEGIAAKDEHRAVGIHSSVDTRDSSNEVDRTVKRVRDICGINAYIFTSLHSSGSGFAIVYSKINQAKVGHRLQID